MQEKVSMWVTIGERSVKLFRDPMFFPLCFMIFVCYLGWQWVPRIATGHINLLDTTAKTLESMDETLNQSNKILNQLLTQPYPAEDFRQLVHDEHATAEQLITETREAVNETKAKVEEIHQAVTKK